MPKTNPNGANGSTSDPREQACWDFYVESLTEGGKGNAYQSAIKAGYSKKTANQITVRSWFKDRQEKLRRKDMVSKAERNLSNMLDLDERDGGDEIKPQLLNIKKDVSVTIAKTLGKDKGYTERTEMTGANGKDLFDVPKEKRESITDKLKNIL